MTAGRASRSSCGSDLAVADLRRVAKRLLERPLAKGTTLFREGQPSAGCWIVEKGSVSVFKVSPGGRVQILETCAPGSLLGLASAIDGRPYLATAKVREDSVLFFVPRAELLAAMKTSPSVAIAVAHACAARLRRLAALAASIALCGARERVAAYLVAEAERVGIRRPDGRVNVVLGSPQHEIASGLGVAREVYARTLAALERDGLIERARNRVSILDVGALRCAAGEAPCARS